MGLTIFWIEDDPIYESATRHIERDNHTIIIIDNPEEASERIEEIAASDLVILDMIVKQKDFSRFPGLHILRELRKVSTDIPVIVLTVVDRAELREELEPDVSRILIKPITPRELRDIVYEVLGITS